MFKSMLTLVVLALSSPSVAASPSVEEKAVLDGLQAACEAFRKGDVAFLEGFLADGFTQMDSAGNVTDRAATLAEVRAKEPRYEVFRNHDMKVRLYGDTAVVIGITSVKGVSGGSAFEADFRFTDTLIKRDGRWRIAASHISRLPKPAPPATTGKP
ncbi:nuclear transport factor 2 family protein [Myxococcus qinghaiensis]|uniref:nuclear transport factor 2 family protein n=1 Tax=Myxococcus qinghaiensis TaxID=2906758 RepID=UPI0020A6DB40|nr:nuclear transport factor 2 family protein [Myxococcus qinghaiensis]MCP3161509.1 nuclear transport factor 2 family protein [Myxococcus qinghaiensis]